MRDSGVKIAPGNGLAKRCRCQGCVGQQKQKSLPLAIKTRIIGSVGLRSQEECTQSHGFRKSCDEKDGKKTKTSHKAMNPLMETLKFL